MTETKSLAPAENKPVDVRPKALPLAVGIVPTNMEEVYRLAQYISRSELAPKDYRGKTDNCVAAILMGADLGLKPMQAIRYIAVINGRPSIWGDGLLACVMNHPQFGGIREYFDGDGDAKVAICKVMRKGVGEVERKFSVADAKVAKLWGKKGREGQDTPWITFPDRMLQMRARGFACRDAFADALTGVSLAEESVDLAPPKIINPDGETFDPADELSSRPSDAEQAALPEPEPTPGPEVKQDIQAPAGFTEKEIDEFDGAMAQWQHASGMSKADKINGLMDWVKKQWPTWNEKGTKEQVADLIKARDAILKEIRAGA